MKQLRVEICKFGFQQENIKYIRNHKQTTRLKKNLITPKHKEHQP